MAVNLKISLRLENVEQFKRLGKDLSAGKSPRVKTMLKQWGGLYRSFVQRRFVRLSRSGGGAWPDLKPATKKRRRKARRGARGPRQFAILRDTSTLFGALDPTFSGRSGQFQKLNRLKLTVGYGGPKRHPVAKMTTARLAEIHHEGQGNNPRRSIIVLPDQQTLRQIERVANKQLLLMAKDYGVS